MKKPRSTRRRFLQTLTAGVACPTLASCASTPPAAKKTRPRNVLLLMTDQHRFDALGFAGNPAANTPRLDELAKTGTVLERAFCQNPVCVPGRNSILLGRYSHSHGVMLNTHWSNRELASLPQVLREHGYRTACFGKLHVLGRDDLDWDLLDTGEDRPRSPVPDEQIVLGPMLQGGRPLGQPAPFEETENVEWYVKERTIEFFREHGDEPWFVQCSFNKPHPPFQPPARLWSAVDRASLEIPRYPEDDLDDVNPTAWRMMVTRGLDQITDDDVLDAFQGFYGNVAFCDEMFGEVLAELDRLGMRDDTLVIYTADSGEMLYAHRLWTKFSLFDEAARVPLVVSLPGVVRSGRRSRSFAEHIDLFPTVLGALDLPVPKTVQGRSMLPLLTGETASHRQFARSEYGDMMAMHVDDRYKFVDNGDRFAPELYDRREDPREITNLAGRPELAPRVEQMKKDLREWQSQDVVERAEHRGVKKKRAPRTAEE